MSEIISLRKYTPKEYNTAENRVCSLCQKILPLTTDNFYKDPKRKYGLMYICKPCVIQKMKGRDKRTGKWGRLSPEKKAKYIKSYLDKRQEGIGRAQVMMYYHRKADKKKGLVCDLTPYFILMEIFQKECVYCGVHEEKMGCDRLDNTKGHTMDNVVPCCSLCNITRMDNYTFEEMLLLGKSIRKIKDQRRLAE